MHKTDQEKFNNFVIETIDLQQKQMEGLFQTVSLHREIMNTIEKQVKIIIDMMKKMIVDFP